MENAYHVDHEKSVVHGEIQNDHEDGNVENHKEYEVQNEDHDGGHDDVHDVGLNLSHHMAENDENY